MPQSKYRRGKRRRMDKFALTEISAVTSPAQKPALAAIRKVDDEDVSKGGDMVDLLTSSDEGHQHGIYIKEYYDHDGDEKGMTIYVGYAMSPDAEHTHDHQIMMNTDGTYEISENVGHTHTIDSGRLQEIMMMRMMMKTDEFEKQELTSSVRERLAREGQALPDGSFPIRNRSDLRNAIRAFGRARSQDRGRVARHIRRRARALRAVDMLPEEGTLASLLKSHENGEDVVDKEDSMSDDLKKAKEEIASLQAEMEKLSKVAALSTAHKAHYDSFTGDDVEKQRDAFLAATDAARDAAITKAEEAKKAADPVVFTAEDGTEYRKSDDPRLVKMAIQGDKDRKETEELRKAAMDSILEKRAESELANLPGELSVRKAMLAAIDGIKDEDLRKGAQDALKAHNAKMAGAFKVIGVGSEPIAKAEDSEAAHAELEKLAKAHAADKGVDFSSAYVAMSEAHPELYKKAVG